jgi:AraC-like DNA-binding protein
MHASSPAAPVFRFSTDGMAEPERPILLREFFLRQGVRYDGERVGSDPVEVDVTLQRFPGLQLTSGRVQGARFRRTRESPHPTEDVALLVNPTGLQSVTQRGREVVLGDGDAALISMADPLETVHRPPGNILALRFPRSEIAPYLAAPQDCFVRRIPSGSPELRLLTDYIRMAVPGLASSPRSLQQSIASHCYELTALALGATRDAAELARGSGLRAARLLAVKQDATRNLARSDLSVVQLARRHGCTPRYIQRLFESEGTCFTEYLLTQRLARAHRLLTDPRRMDEKIVAIASDVGFGDLSHFNRMFRRRYGDTPSGIRASARPVRGS